MLQLMYPEPLSAWQGSKEKYSYFCVHLNFLYSMKIEMAHQFSVKFPITYEDPFCYTQMEKMDW